MKKPTQVNPVSTDPPQVVEKEIGRKTPRIRHWDPEDPASWREGKRHALRNLTISIPCLVCSFAVWLFWSIITVQMKNLGFPFSDAQLFTLSAIAGLSGATLRIVNSFMIAIAGGRIIISVSTLLLILPSLGAGIALQSKSTPYEIFIILAALSGIGGGNFSSSMANITYFFPKSRQGIALGLNAGLGNLGVSLMQVILPLAVLTPLFGVLGGDGMMAVSGSQAGQLIWIQNNGLIWVPLLMVLGVIAWWGLDTLPMYDVGHPIVAILKVTGLGIIGFAGAAVGSVLLIQLKINMWIVLPITVMVTLLLMKLIRGEMGKRIDRVFAIFKNKHTWIMTYLYVMTFGSFIGYSAALPLLIRIVFGQLPDGTPNPHAPNPFAYAWLGPLVGSIARPLGGWLSDKFGGAKVTFWDTVMMIVAAFGTASYLKAAGTSASPEQFFLPFLILFLVLFVTTGIGNGSTFRMVPFIFKPEQAGPVLGWTAAIAAYGSFIIPKVFGAQIEAKTPEHAFYGFAVYYLTCLAACWWWYERKNAEKKC